MAEAAQPAVFDPLSAVSVETMLQAALPGSVPLRLNGAPVRLTAATSTWVWRLDIAPAGVPNELAGVRILRIFRPAQADVARREASVCSMLAAAGFPAPRSLWCGELGGGFPALLQECLPGRPAADVLGSWKLPRVVRGLGALQARLHGFASELQEVPRHTAMGYLQKDLMRRRAAVRAVDAEDNLGWLLATADAHDARTFPGDYVLCHGDFHPLNALVDEHGSIGIVDWTDVCVADRHLDVARTLALYWVASVAVGAPLGRAVLRALGGWIAVTHRRAYERASVRALDERALCWWQVVHLVRGWLQLAELAEGAVPSLESTTTAAFPADLPGRLLARCRSLRAWHAALETRR